jgi:hypothetical protein
MKRNLIVMASIVLGLTGCTSSVDHLIEPNRPAASQPSQPRQPSYTQYQYEEPTPEKQEAYEKTMVQVASGIQNDPNYKRLALDTPEKKEWFKKLTYQLWDRQITRQQFVSEGLKRYPDHGYELNFIVRGFTFN